MEKLLIKQLMNSENFWTLNKRLVAALGVEETFLISVMSEAEKMLSDDEGWFYQTTDTLEAFTGIKKDRQLRILKNLISKGVLEKELRGLPRKRYFKFNYEVIRQLVVANPDNCISEIPTPSNRENRHNKESIINNIDKKDKKKKKRDEGYSDDFLEFWKLYNKSVNKPKSFTLWKKKNFSEEELKEVMKKVKLYVDNTEKRFRKDPERYIRDNCWENEVIIKSNVNRYGKPEPKNISTTIKTIEPVDEWEEYNKMKRGNK